MGATQPSLVSDALKFSPLAPPTLTSNLISSTWNPLIWSNRISHKVLRSRAIQAQLQTLRSLNTHHNSLHALLRLIAERVDCRSGFVTTCDGTCSRSRTLSPNRSKVTAGLL